MGVQARDKTVQLGCDALGRPCACAIPTRDRIASSKVALTDLDTMLEDALRRQTGVLEAVTLLLAYTMAGVNLLPGVDMSEKTGMDESGSCR